MVDLSSNSDETVADGYTSSTFNWLWPIALLLLAPQILWGPVPGKKGSLFFGLPRIYSGDEPHYLLMLNSLVNDCDLDLSNNYAAVHQGANQAGEVHAGTPIDHHVVWLIHGRRILWRQVYEQSSKNWRTDDFGHPVPTRSPKLPDVNIPPQEFSWHQPGLPILLAILLFPLRGTAFIEPAAVFCSGISTIVAMLFFYALVRSYYKDRRDAYFITAIAFLGTPVWHYGRTLFTEPYLLATTVCSYTLYLRFRRPFLAGGLLGIGIMMKRSLILLFFPLIVDALLRRDRIGALKLSCPLAGCLVLLAIQNQYFFGNPIGCDSPVPLGNPVRGTLGLTFSTNHGLILFAPAALIALTSWPAFFQRNFRHAVILSSAALLYFGFWASLDYWHGSVCYGPRYLVPVLPFFFVAFPSVYNSSLKISAVHWLVVFISLLSVYINLIGAVACGNAWETHPASLLIQSIIDPD